MPILIIAALEPEMDPDKLLRWIVCEQNGLTWSPLYQLMDVGSRSLEQVQLTVSPTMNRLLLHTTWSPLIDIYIFGLINIHLVKNITAMSIFG